MRRKWETNPLLCLKFSTWAEAEALVGFYHWHTDKISFLQVSPKSNCLRRLWCQRELWIETIQHDTLPRSSDVQHRETRFWEFPTFQSSLAKGRWWGFPKTRIGLRTRIALFGIPTKINLFPFGILGISDFDPPYPFRRHHKFPSG